MKKCEVPSNEWHSRAIPRFAYIYVLNEWDLRAVPLCAFIYAQAGRSYDGLPLLTFGRNVFINSKRDRGAVGATHCFVTCCFVPLCFPVTYGDLVKTSKYLGFQCFKIQAVLEDSSQEIFQIAQYTENVLHCQ